MADKRLAEIISTGQYATLLYECETYEVEHLSVQKQSPSSFYYACFLLGYMINNDLNNCRFLWKRMPTDVKKNDDVKGIWEVAKHLWNRNYEGVYQSVAALNPSSVHLKEIIQYFVRQLRQRTLQLISNAYANINTNDLMKCLGVPDVNALNELVTPLNWKFDATNNLYIPEVVSVKPPEMPTGLEAIKGHTQRSVFLELE
ncbi:hypothetical protein C9374_005113 [Naegleria lovaniensis]|uniref:CSN8/PSMD8/EIF3K domain-containing protein n=1 Tax=Naegleria lovaniensis TaxID=51637 RepID=A0AA88KK39_NAELO|nr:uncharacterized protein C9374_005113 [Naegleria lovaniensis]KAG2382533.1 hypothetical protein C9374_005113 [Naegleria lovaniensis]